jgi:hypothetical protein
MRLETTTQLLDISGNLISASGSNGSITVAGSSVPEPSSLVLTLIGGVFLFAAGWIWNRARLLNLPGVSAFAPRWHVPSQSQR